MKVNFLEIKNVDESLDALILNDISEIISKREFVGGRFNDRFENDFAEFVGSPNCIGVGNGLDALTLLIQSLEISKNKKILIPNNTFIATALAAVNLGYELICVDVDPISRNMSVETLTDVPLDDVGLVIFVPLYGNPSGGDRVRVFCEQQNIPIIFDCAQAHGAKVDGKSLGERWSNCTWSFYPGKNLGAYGDAGAITTASFELSELIRARGNYGSLKKYHHELIGGNSRLDAIQAAVLSRKLAELDEINKARAQIAARYTSGIKNKFITTPQIDKGNMSSWHLFVLQVYDHRSSFIDYLESNGIQTSIHYPKTICAHPCFKDHNIEHSNLSVSESLSETIVSLPIGAHLTDNQVDYVIDTINSWDGKND